MNLYEDLGVSKNASKEEIRRAFKRKAKENHPDRGGSHEKMAAITVAHRILSDDEARARYDSTGQQNKGPSIEDMAMAKIAEAFDEIFERVDSIETFNIIEKVMEVAVKKCGELNVLIKAAEKKIKKVDKAEKRLNKKGVVLGPIMNAIREGASRKLFQLNMELSVAEKVMEILKPITYKTDLPDYRAMPNFDSIADLLKRSGHQF